MTAAPKTAARLFLDSLGAGGVDYVFANAGTDFAPILEALLEYENDQAAAPEFIICPHENLAVAMAHGYFLASGRAQGVMVHVNVGVANALCGLLNAARDNIPMLFASGRTPITEQGRLGSRDNFIHWGQEMFDQGAMLREFVKWDYELRCPEQTGAAVGRALAIAQSEPAGPVYLSLPREVLAATADCELAPQAPTAAASPPSPDPAAIDRAAQLLATAKSPLLITARAGRTARGVAALSTLAEKFAIPVVEAAANYMCLPGDHEMHAGFTPAPYLIDADLIIVVDAPVPWTPSRINPSPDCPVIQMGPDPLFEPLPFRGFRSDISIKTETAAGLEALSAAVAASKHLDQPIIDARRTQLAPKLAKARNARREKATRPGAKITHDYVSHCLNQALGKGGILVNERGCLREAMELTEPGTFFGPTIAGGLGASIGIALGIKLAAPDRMVAAALGDGSCIFNNPVACLQTAVARQLPILIVVLNNEAWHSVKASTLQVYPDGATAHSNRPPLTSLTPSPDYAGVAKACGAHGAKVSDPAALQQVLSDAVAMVREQNKTVLVDIAIEMN